MAKVYNDFYCIKCGNKGIGLFRNAGHMRSKFHRKKLYCPHCKLIINHIEVRDLEEKKIFLEKFENGEFELEAEESIKECNNEDIISNGRLSWFR